MSELSFAPASERNKHPILEQLRTLLPAGARVLEIGSGYAQHAVFFCQALPTIDWQPSERAAGMPSLETCLQQQRSANLRNPVQLDVLEDTWPCGSFNVVYTANTAHIMPWSGVERLFERAGGILPAEGQLIIYGPFNMDGQYTSAGNRSFDHELRAQDPRKGLRDVRDIDKLARKHHMNRVSRIEMPANNMLLVFKRDD